MPLLPDDVDAWVFGLPWDGAHGQEWALERDARVWVQRALAMLPARPAGPTVLVAHSFGANVLLDHLDARPVPDRLKLVLLAPFFRATRKQFDWPLISYYLNDFHLFLAGGIAARGGPGRWTRTADRDEREGARPDRPVRVAAFLRAVLPDAAARPGRAHHAVLVAGGEHDNASFPADCRALAAALPAARVEILAGCATT